MSRPQGSKYYCLPANHTFLSVPYKSDHLAVDYGYLYGHENPPLIAISDAVVVENRKDSEGGNVIVIGWNYGNFTWYAEYMHNAKYAEVSKGTVVKQGEKIATMGTTGKSTGVHVHLIIYKLPLGTPFRNSKQNRVNPNDYCFRFPNQTVNRDNKLIKDVPKNEPSKKSNEVIAQEVLTGKWGNGADRQKRLEEAGYDYYVIQSIVNGQSKPQPKPQPKPPTPKDEYISVGGKQTLYRNSTGDAHYGARVQNLKTRDMKVLDKANGRTLVEAGSPFDVSSFWVQTSTPPTPKPKVKYAKVGGKQTLYRASSGNARYGIANQNLSTRDMKVLSEANGRVQVDATQARNSKGGRAFDVNSFWVVRDRVSFVYKDK